MEFIYAIGGFPIGIILFLLLNEIFYVYYLGFKGIGSTFMGCWFAGTIIVFLFGGIVKWLIIAGIILWVFSKISKGKKNQKKETPGK